MKTYKIGELPFVFTSRKQIGDFTIFDNGGGCTIKIKTDELNRHQSIVQDTYFSKLSNDEVIMSKVKNFSAEDFVTKLQDEFSKQGLGEKLCATVDNTGAIVISNIETEEELVIENGNEEVIENFLKFIIENGLEVNKENITNFSEILNFGIISNAIDKATGVKLGHKIGSDSMQDKISAYKIITPLVPQLGNARAEIATFFKTDAAKALVGSKLQNDLKHLFETYSNMYDKLKAIQTEKFTDPKFKKALNNYNTYAKVDTKLELATKTSEKEKNIDTAEKFDNDKRNFLMKCKKDPKYKESEEGKAELQKLMARKKAGNFSVKNFDDKQDEKDKATENFKDKVAMILNDQKLKFNAVFEANKDVVLKGRYAKFKKTLDNNLAKIEKRIDTIMAKHDIPTAKQLEEKAKQIAEAIKKKNEELDKMFGELSEGVVDGAEELKKIAPDYNFTEEIQKLAARYSETKDEDVAKKLYAKLIDTNIPEDKAKSIIKKLGKSSDEKEKENNSDSELTIEKFKEVTGLNLNNTDKNKAILSSLAKNDTEAVNRVKELLKSKYNDDKKVEEIMEKLVGKKNTEDKNDEGIDFSEIRSFSDLLYEITSKMVTNFDAHKVQDSEFGVCYEDKFGSLHSTDPDKDPNSKLLWESKDGKEEPTESLEEESIMDEDEMDGALGMESDDSGESGGDNLDLGGGSNEGDDLDLGDDSDDLDLGDESESDSDSEESDDLDFSEDSDDLDLDMNMDLDDEESDDDLDLDLNDTEGESDDLDLDLGNEPESESESEDKAEPESETETAKHAIKESNESLRMALETIDNMYNKLADKIK